MGLIFGLDFYKYCLDLSEYCAS